MCRASGNQFPKGSRRVCGSHIKAIQIRKLQTPDLKFVEREVKEEAGVVSFEVREYDVRRHFRTLRT